MPIRVVKPANQSYERIVLVHPEMGVYLGSCMGMGFWTVLDVAGQDRAVTFNNEHEAREHVSSWEENNDPDTYEYVPVPVGIGSIYATPQELLNAGIAREFVAPMLERTGLH